MKDLRRRFNRFCFANRNKGIPNLMMYISIGCLIINLFSLIDPSNALYRLLCFDRSLILQGQLWRLFTYPVCYFGRNLLWTAIFLICFTSLARGIENVWGTFRFNLFYFSGVILTDIYCMIVGGQASISHLHMSLFLAYATLFPNAQFYFMYIIPVKAWVLAIVDLVSIVYQLLIVPFPFNVVSLIPLANYFLFFGKDVRNVVPISWQVNAQRTVKKATARSKTIPFNAAGSYEATHARPKADYNHKCTVCGRTDVSNPELEFRYCSRCNGYYCYCEDHISNHAHIQ